MTNPPTDEELALICYSAPKGGHYLQDGHRALFTAGERRMLERCIDIVAQEMRFIHVGKSGLEVALSHLESLRDAPAGEPRYTCASCGGEWAEETAWCPHCAKKRTGEPPAKPEAAGEEPPRAVRALLQQLEHPLGAGVNAYVNVPLSEIPAVRRWLDRPAPAAKEAGERFDPPTPKSLLAEKLTERFRELPVRIVSGADRELAMATFERAANYYISHHTDRWNGDDRVILISPFHVRWTREMDIEEAERIFGKNVIHIRACLNLLDSVAYDLGITGGFSPRKRWKADELTTALHELKEERDRLRARVAELQIALCESERLGLSEGGFGHALTCTCGTHPEATSPTPTD